MFKEGDIVNVIIPEEESDYFGIEHLDWQRAMDNGPYEILEAGYTFYHWKGFKLNYEWDESLCWPEWGLLPVQTSQGPNVEDLL